MGNAQQFAADCDRVKRDLELVAIANFRAKVNDILHKVVFGTPVAKRPYKRRGLLRGNWQLTASSPATRPNENVDPAGGRTVADGEQFVAALPDRIESIPKLFLANLQFGAMKRRKGRGGRRQRGRGRR